MSDFDKPDIKKERTYDKPPPIANEFLVQLYKRWRRKHESKHIPKDYLAAAQWWLDHQEPRWPDEQPQMDHDKKGEPHWSDPFIIRVTVTWRAFLGLTEPQKAFVIDGIEKRNTPWRGDDIKFYKLVVEQQAIMDKDPEKYKTHALKHMANALKKIGERAGALKGDEA